MGVTVRTAWGSNEAYPAVTDWDVDRDQGLTLVGDGGDGTPAAVAVFAPGQWCCVVRDGAAS